LHSFRKDKTFFVFSIRTSSSAKQKIMELSFDSVGIDSVVRTAGGNDHNVVVVDRERIAQGLNRRKVFLR
jgi:hypothetical protein